MIVVKNILFTHINVSTVHKHIRFIDICSCFFYIEGSSFCVVTFLGSIKCSYSSKASLYFTLCRTHLYAQTDIFLNMYVTYYTLKTLYKTSNTFFYNLNTFFHFLSNN